MASKKLQDTYDAAVKVQSTSPEEAIKQLRDVALGGHPNDVDSIKVLELRRSEVF